jgi:murein DD-endopeptidase MepM/ murein hydrolase activator NlpD
MNPTQQQNGSTMEITNHLVNPGETLSQIATRYNTNVAQLRQMNPFITNPSAIKPGWNLSVPKSAQAEAVAQPASPLVASAEPATKTEAPSEPAPKPIDLGPKKDFAETCTPSFKDQQKPCSSTYGTAIYATDEQEFWLLPERAASSMKEAMHALENQISPSKSRDERLKGLDDSGLLSYFLEPKLSNFLEGEQRQRMEEIQTQEPNIEMDPGMVLRSRQEAKRAKEKDAPKAEAPKTDTQRSRIDQLQADNDTQNRIRNDYSELHKLRSEWLALKKIAIAAAVKTGHSYENGTLFAPAAIEARTRVQNYLEKRKALISKGGIQPQAQEDIAKLLETDKKKRDELQKCLYTCEGDTYAYLAWKHGEAKSFAYHEYTDAIIKVAEYGIALPEYALISGNDITSGIEQFKLYLDTEKQQSEINDRLRKKYKNWIEATGQNAQAPAGLVEAERTEWDRLQVVKQGLHEKAKQKVAADPIRRHLLWEPEQFEPQPIDRLIKEGFPLREVSTLGASGTPLKWFSLLTLKGAPKLLEEDLKKAGKSISKVVEGIPANGDGGASKNSAQKVFGQWLESQGALRIGDQVGDWFDTTGWFNIDKFYSFLQSSGYKVTELEDAGARKEWGEHLKQVVFKKSVRGEVRLFDKSPQAQFVRCLAPPQKKLHGEVKMEGPSFSAAEGFQTSASASLSFDLARGEVELLKVDMPTREKAKDVTVDYYLEGNPQLQTLNLGRMSFHFGARAWGYAGASLMLAGSIKLSPINGNAKYGATLSPVKPAQREDAEAKAERKTHDEMIKTKADNGDTSPTPDLVYQSKALTAVDTKSSGQVLSGRADKVQIEDGMKANFNLFAGVQAGIQLTGALNWAPPKALAALRAGPATGINNSKEATSASQWLTLANLSGSLGAAYGAGLQGNAGVSLDKGKFILNLKATVVLGPGASGSFKFEVGYEAVVELINIYRRELYKAKGASISWITPEAAEQASALNMLGAVGLDVAMIYMMGIDVIMNLYDAMTSSGKGGPIADTIIEYENQAELQKWFMEATPAALGPLLMTLSSEPEEFSVISTNQDTSETKSKSTDRKYVKQEARLLQQRALDRVIYWVGSTADGAEALTKVQQLFEDACKCMNKLGIAPKESGQAYCENRYRLDNFMAVPVLSMERAEGVKARARYKSNVKKMGQRIDAFCKLDFRENSYVPMTTMKYSGPL